MAKSTLPGFKTGGGVLTKVISAVVVIAVLALVIKHPTEAAALVTGGLHAAEGAVDGISAFLQRVIG